MSSLTFRNAEGPFGGALLAGVSARFKGSAPLTAAAKARPTFTVRTPYAFSDPVVRKKSEARRDMADAIEQVYREGAVLMQALDDLQGELIKACGAARPDCLPRGPSQPASGTQPTRHGQRPAPFVLISIRKPHSCGEPPSSAASQL